MDTATDLKPRMILKLSDYVVHHFPAADVDSEYLYAVVDRECEVLFESDDRTEAEGWARDSQADADSNRRNELKDAIGDALETCEDEATLKAVLALLKRSK
jgi:hypothetical protein